MNIVDGKDTASLADAVQVAAGADALLLGDLAKQLESPKLSSLADVKAVTDSFGWYRQVEAQNEFNGRQGSHIREGRTFMLHLSPGIVRMSAHDEARKEKTTERAGMARIRMGDTAAGWVNEETGEIDLDDYWETRAGSPRKVITQWSKKSRSNMVRSLGELDYSEWINSPGTLAMVTLTYPGKWKHLVPTGKQFKKHFDAFRKRWQRSVGPWACLWKMEFQRRGAPHMHMLMKVPATVTHLGGYHAKLDYLVTQSFEEWLSWTWADVVNADDPAERRRHERAGTGVDFSGTKFTDPRKIALYFLGHSSKSVDGKEYQHIVPEIWREDGAGPGRFWGSAGLPKATVALHLDINEYFHLRRVLRHVLKARNWEASVMRAQGIAARLKCERPPAHLVKAPRMWTLGSAGGIGGGWVLLNDALSVGMDMSRILAGSAGRQESLTRSAPSSVLDAWKKTRKSTL